MKINPIPLKGSWKEGYALDRHTIYSVPLGEDQYGKMKYDTKRSEIGELLYQLKYNGQEDAVYDIIDLIVPFLKRWNIKNKVDLIIPAPPSKKRDYQPVYRIAEEMATLLEKCWVHDLLEKIDLGQMKDLSGDRKKEAIENKIVKRRQFKRVVNILVVDDLYQSVTTLEEVCRVLKADHFVNHIYVLTMTKTKG